MTLKSRNASLLCVLLGVLTITTPATVLGQSPGSTWRQYAKPEEAGWSSAKLDEVRQFAEDAGSGAVMVVYKGNVLVAWGDIERRFKCHSMRKSFLSALYGIYVRNGRIDLQKTLADLGIDDNPPLTDQEKQAKIIDLIRARSGVYHTAAKEPGDMRATRPKRGSHAPGDHWWYNNWDFNALGTIFEQEAGKKIFEDFKERVADPLQMEDFRLRDTFYELEPSRSIHPAYAFRMSARDLARFGQLYLQDGEWRDKQIIPADWIRESTALHSGEGLGYGYMWWVSPTGFPGDRSPRLSQYNSFSARGMGGHRVVVIPDAEFVFVHRSDTDATIRPPRRPAREIIEMILAARTGEAKRDPKLVSVRPKRFANATPAPPEREATDVDPRVFDAYVGVYEQPPQTHLTVYKYKDRLFGISKGLGEAELLREGPDRFFLKAADIQITFERNGDGNVTHAVMTYFGQPRRIPKTQ